MTEPLRPYRFHGALSGDAAPPPDPSDRDAWERHLAEAFDALVDGRAGATAPPGIAALLGGLGRGGPVYPGAGEPRPVGAGPPGLVERAQLTAGLHVLDVGCGPGHDAIRAAAAVQPGGSVLGIDLSPASIAAARRAAAAAGVHACRFEVASAAALPGADRQVDRVLCNAVIGLFADRPATLAQLARVTAPGGLLVLADATSRELDADLRSALGGWGNGVGLAPSPDALGDELRRAGWEPTALRARWLNRDDLLTSAVAVADRPRGWLARRLGPWLDRLAGRVGWVEGTARRGRRTPCRGGA